MRLLLVVTLFFLCLLCACNTITGGKESAQPKPEQQLEDAEFQKIRKLQDSLLELRQKKPRKKDLDTLKPVQT